MKTVLTGLANLLKSPHPRLKNKKIGLLANPSSTDTDFVHTRFLIDQIFPGQLKALFSPQHGFFAEKQDNMIESDDITDPELNIPVFSLYGKTRIPSGQMFDAIDTLIVDLIDVGTRVYTFIYTVSYCLEAAKKYGKNIIILDRPNPVNGISIEGNLLKENVTSFVGRYPLPMRHGLTIGELAQLINKEYKIECELDIIPLKGWERKMYYTETGLPWVAPSPNLPTPISAMVYPGQVIFEGTNISEGRGTSQPFELFGAPFLDTKTIIQSIEKNAPHGIILRNTIFEPTSNKWAGKACKGFQIHITDPSMYNSYETSLMVLQAIIKTSPKEFKWKSPPYEYEFEKKPIDLIIGDPSIRKRIESMENINDISASWKKELLTFGDLKKKYHLYE